MSEERALELMRIEVACIKRADTCDRECGKCDLVQDTDELLEAYSLVIKLLEERG